MAIFEKDIDPIRRLPRLELNTPKFKRTAVNARTHPTTWAPTLRVFPPVVSVLWPPAGRAETVPRLALDGASWEGTLHTIRFPGLGRTVVCVQHEPDGPPRKIQAMGLPDPETAEAVVLADELFPVEWFRLDWFTVGLLQMNRLRVMLLGLSAYAYLTDPELWGGNDVGLAAWAATWQQLDGVPAFNPSVMTDLRDPTTWNI